MANDVQSVLEAIKAGRLSPRDGQRRLAALRGASRPAGTVAAADRADRAREPAPVTEARRQVAVVGLAGRFAGARSARELWENLIRGECSIREVPAARWDAARYYDPDPAVPGKTNSRWGGFLDDVGGFDPLFFNISGREAEATDPQQRLFLETCWNALEDAGYATEIVSRGRCGVYAGAPASEYGAERNGAGPDAQSLMGNDSAILAARISYVLNLSGPSIALNTACSSSLVAVHLACQAIETGQCDMALAGGVCLFLTPGFYLSAAKAGMLSPDGLCKTFDRRANGFVPGEGVGVVVLKELAAARQDGDHLYGVILAAETNQDGKTNGITAPSSRAQTALQLAAYRRAGISPDTISVIEAHGTGTALGDPIEVEALTRSFREYTTRSGFCAIGSVKTNIGHTGQAAGVAGLIKLLLALEHEVLPPTLHFSDENERIGFAETPFFVAAAPMPWPRRPGAPRRAAVSSFGYSGTNAHLIVQEPPDTATADADAGPDRSHLILISAKTGDALAQRSADLEAWLDGEGRRTALADVAYTLHAGRKHFGERRAFVVKSHDELREAVATMKSGAGRLDRPRLRSADKRAWGERLRREMPADAIDRPDRASLERLADLYEKGLDLDPGLIDPGGAGRRIPMPGYPFSRERYWLGAGAATDPAPSTPIDSPSRAPLRHCLLAAGDSRAGAHGYRFRPAGEGAFVTGHVVGGEGVLAAAVSLEMARAAGEHARAARVTHIGDVRWRRPLSLQQAEGLEIRLEPDGEHLRFAIAAAGGTGVAGATGVVGYGDLDDAGERLDLQSITDRCPEWRSGLSCYERLRGLGLEHGPGFQTLRDLRFNDREALARLEWPEDLPDPSSDLVLHPGLLDGALQAIVAFGGSEAERGDSAGAYVPCALDRLEIRGALPRRCHAHLIRRDDETLEVRVTDEAGRILVRMDGLSLARVRTTAKTTEVLQFRPVWRPRPQSPDVSMEQTFRAAPTFVLCAARDELTPGALPDFTDGFDALFRLTHALMARRPGGPVTLRFVYRLDRNGTAPPHLAALGAFARTVRLESPDLRFQVIGLPADGDGMALDRLLNDAAGDEMRPAELRYSSGGDCLVRVFEDIATAPRPDGVDPAHGAPILREEGVYVITGGAGGVGLQLARRLARKRAKLLLIGRSALSPARQIELDRLSADGASVIYYRADVTDRDALAGALAAGRERFGALHGVIHAAGVVRDAFLLHKTTSNAHEVLAPKVSGAIWLDWLTRNDPLDFMAFFSSVVSMAGHVGQADYAFANAFLNEFASLRESLHRDGRRHGRTVAIAWGPWAHSDAACGTAGQHGGMWSAAASSRRVPLPAGIEPLDAEEGFAAFEQALAAGEPQVVIVRGDRAAVQDALASDVAVPDRQADRARLSPAVAPVAAGAAGDVLPLAEAWLQRILAEELRLPAARISAHEPFETYGIDSVMVMRLSRRLEADLGELPKTLFFEHQTLGELAVWFAARHGERLARFGGGPAAVLPPAVADAPEVLNGPPAPDDRPTPAARGARGMAAGDERIAIVGVSGRYPMADDLDAFWRNLADGRDCVTEIPPERWTLDGFYDPEKGRPGRSYSKWGGFLSDVDKFDPLFFKIAPNEAALMDPQERLFLETVWRLLEEAGATRASLRGRTGVFVGVMYGHYQLLGSEGRRGISSYASIANRVSYVFDFRGPSLALDTMCSSSLTAIHLACESLRRGECDAAVAGGVNLSLHPQKYVQLSLGGFASSDGRCRSFGAGGDGYVPGEGVGALLLKPLPAAIANGDTIHAVIRGSAINHGGKTNGYTVPNPHAQTDAIAEALRRAGVDPREVSYLEAHGTGTALGDPIEIAALARAFGDERDGRAARCPIGSVKSSIGHLESAAGIAAVTKVLLQMRHQTLAPSLHAEALNPNIDFASSPFIVQHAPTPWRRPLLEEGGRTRTAPRIAGVSSFGAGGANAHLVLEEYEAAGEPAVTAIPTANPERQAIVLSARSRAALITLAGRLADHVETRLDRSRSWRMQLRDDLLRRAAALAGMREGDVGPGDDLMQCGLDKVARVRLGDDLAEACGLDWQGGWAAEIVTVDALVQHLAIHHEARLKPRFGGVEDAAAQGPSIRIGDLAFTLQAGREPMIERLAFVTDDPGALVRRLRTVAAGEPAGPGVWLARVDEARRAALCGPASQARVRALLADRRVDDLAELWVQGAEIDWPALHAGRDPRRISLPGHPLARESHWVASAVQEGPQPMPSERRSMDTPPAAAATAPTAATLTADGRPDGPTPMSPPPPAPDAVRVRLVTDLTALAAAIIGLEPARIEPTVSVGDYGFESLALKELAERISSRFDVAFSPAVFFERRGLAGAADWLLDEYAAQMTAVYRDVMSEPEPPALQAPLPEGRAASGRVSVRPGAADGAGAAAGESREPIAIIGMSGRFPASRDLDAFWEHLRNERDLVTEIPGDRWDWRDFDNEDLPREERCASHWGAFIDDVDKFEPLFFGISPAEAEMMDPQQRLFLQTVWQAIEDAGYRPSALAGRDVGLFAGVQFHDYQHLLHEAGVLTAQSGVGNEHSIVLNRISYLLDLRGPSEPVNTACSSSLVAVHRAVRSLRSGESSLAVAGGISLNLCPHSTVAAGKMGLLSPDGRCKTLDRGANGYVKGEGIGALLLKPLSRAVADGDHVHAVIRGSAINHGGRAASLTAPNATAQAALVHAAVEDAGIDPRTIGYIELHGTGTELGDPVEINGLKTAFRRLGVGPQERPSCGIGSVKTNIGHLEPASGIAGLIKTILGMRHGTLPGTIHLTELNPYIDLRGTPFFVVSRTQPWERLRDAAGAHAPRRAGVSSFGFGGVNAHVLIEEFDATPSPAGAEEARDRLFVFSAKSAAALAAKAEAMLHRLDAWEASGGRPDLDDIAFTLQVGREEMEERLAIVARDAPSVRARLACVVAGTPGDAHIVRGRVAGAGSGKAPADDDVSALARHWVAGGAVDWRALHGGRARRRVPLPAYPFAGKRYWFTPPDAPVRSRRPGAADGQAAAPMTDGGSGIDRDALSGDEYVREELRAILIEKLKLEDEDLDPDRSLQDFGVDSMLSAMIMQTVQERFGARVELNALAEHQTLRSLARYVCHDCLDGDVSDEVRRAGGSRGASVLTRTGGSAIGPKSKVPPELLPINIKGTRQPSFWVHGAAGYSAWFQNLSEALGPDYPLYAFQARGTDGHSAPQMLDDMVDLYVRCIRLTQPKGPYVIGGYSFGGVVAMELARRLHDEGETIRHLVMFDTYPATQEVFDRHFGVYDEDFLQYYLANYSLKIHESPELAIRPPDVAHLPKRLQLAALAHLVQQRGNKRISADDIYMYVRGGLACSEHAEGIYQMYRMQPYDASDVLFFKALDGFTGRASAVYWRPMSVLAGYDYVQPWRDIVAGRVRVIELDNDHLNMLEEPTLTPAARHIEALLKDPPPLDMGDYDRFRASFGEVTRFGCELLVDRFRRSGALPAAGGSVTREELRRTLRVEPAYDRLFHASVDILEREGCARREADRLVVASTFETDRFPGGKDDIDARAATLAADRPEIKDYLPLLTTCQGAVLEVMSGSRDPVDVIFPGGSMTLVAELYKGNFQTDFYNRLVAERVLEHVRRHARRFKYSKIHIFEVGAGTGGTSTFVFEALQNHVSAVRYLYTDVGMAFVQMSRQLFGAKHPYVEFLSFDVEKAPDVQGVEPHTMDVVIAANVLHTTRRMARTLEQCHRLLKPGGLIVINELTQRLDFNTLTFGLTPGWWRYEDEEERIQGSPLLRPEDWAAALVRAGFAEVEIQGIPGVEDRDQAQCLIAATRRVAADTRAIRPGAASDPAGADETRSDQRLAEVPTA